MEQKKVVGIVENDKYVYFKKSPQNLIFSSFFFSFLK